MKENKYSKVKNYKVYGQNSRGELLDTYASSVEEVIKEFISTMVGPEPTDINIISGTKISLVHLTYKKEKTDYYTCPEQTIEFYIVKS